MKFSLLAATLAVAPAAAEIYFKEQFNDEVCEVLSIFMEYECQRFYLSNQRLIVYQFCLYGNEIVDMNRF